MDLNVDTYPNDAAVISLTGRLDLVSAPEFKENLDQLVINGTQLLIIDLGALDFIDSSGLGAIIGALKTARQAGGELRLVNPQEQARKILELTTLDKVFQIHNSVEEALAEA